MFNPRKQGSIETILGGKSAHGGAASDGKSAHGGAADSPWIKALDPVNSWRPGEHSGRPALDTPASRDGLNNGLNKSDALHDALFGSAFTPGANGSGAKMPGGKLTYSSPADTTDAKTSDAKTLDAKTPDGKPTDSSPADITDTTNTTDAKTLDAKTPDGKPTDSSPADITDITDITDTVDTTNTTDTVDTTNTTDAKTLDAKTPDGKPTDSSPADITDTADTTDIADATDTVDTTDTDNTTTTAPGDATPAANDANTLHVGPGHPFASLGEAVAASKPGDTILLEAGTYASDYSTIGHALTIKGVGGLAHLKAVEPIPNGKAILVVRADVTIENIKFTDASVPDRNGAGIRHEGGDLEIVNSIFENNENGILSAPNATATVTVRNSEFIGNGYGDGRSHGIYVNQIASLDIEGSTFRDTSVGHHIKSRAQETSVRDSTIDDGQGDSSYSVDLPNGGRAILEGNTLIQTGLAGINTSMVAYGAEGNLHSENSLLIKDNLFIDHHANGKGVNNHTDTVVILQGNTFQDVETEVIGPHQFVAAGASGANPAVDSGAIPAEDTVIDGLAGGRIAESLDETLTATRNESSIASDLFPYATKDGNHSAESIAIDASVNTADSSYRIGSDGEIGDWFGFC